MNMEKDLIYQPQDPKRFPLLKFLNKIKNFGIYKFTQRIEHIYKCALWSLGWRKYLIRSQPFF